MSPHHCTPTSSALYQHTHCPLAWPPPLPSPYTHHTDDRIELQLAESMAAKYKAKQPAIVVCHSYPLNWALPTAPTWFVGDPCPPDRKDSPWVYSVGRTMFETDLLPKDFLPK
jgi:hypothetical protein